MLNRLPTPTQTPPLGLMLDDLGNHSLAEVAKALDISERKLQRWVARDDAPRTVLLAVYWLTRWGMSVVHCEAHNAAILQASIAATLQREVDRLHAQLAWVTAIADFGAANSPSLELHVPRLRLTLVQPPGERPSPAPKPRATKRRAAGKP